MELHETNPEQFQEPVLPPLWNINDTIDTGIFIDAYMHLLFLGGMKAIAKYIVPMFLAKHKKLAPFIRALNPKLKSLSDLRGENMPIGKTSGESTMTFGGYLSRDWVSVIQTSKWLFSHVVTCGVLEENLVKTLADIIILYNCLVSRVMGGADTKCISRHINAFLTKIHKWDRLNGIDTQKCMLISRPNFLTLLNIPDSIERFGPPRSVWEGGEMGEGSIPKLKQRIHNLKPNFAQNAMKSYYEEQTMVSLIDESIRKIENNSDKSFVRGEPLANLCDAFQKLHVQHKNRTPEELLQQNIAAIPCDDKIQSGRMQDSDNKLIGFVLHNNFIDDNIKVWEMVVDMSTNKMYFLLEKSCTLFEITVVSDIYDPTIVCGVSFFEMRCSTVGMGINCNRLLQQNLRSGLVLRHDDNNKLFSALTYNWLELTSTTTGLKFVFPRHPQFHYKE